MCGGSVRGGEGTGGGAWIKPSDGGGSGTGPGPILVALKQATRMGIGKIGKKSNWNLAQSRAYA